MKKYFWFLVSLIFLAIIFVAFFYFKSNSAGQVCFDKNCFVVKLAKTETERERGLMNVTQLDKNKGMLFIFEKEGDYPFWMKNTLIFLDIIWIDKNGKVVFVKENAEPCLPADGAGEQKNCPAINPGVQAKYVLEINAGLAQKFGIKVGRTAVVTP